MKLLLELSALADGADGTRDNLCSLSSSITSATFSSTMPRRSPSPDSHNRNRNSDNRDKYRGRRDDAAGYQRNADRESRDGYRDRRGYPERDTRRSYHDGNEFNDNDRRRRDGGDGGQRRKNGYDSHDDGGRRRDEGSRDHRIPNRPDEGDDKNLRRDELRDRRERGDESSRRSASPRRSRPHSPSRSRPRSPSATSPPPDDKAKPNFAPSGLLAAATNTVKNSDGTSTLLKYNEPPEARKPLVGWRLYVFKGDEQVGAQPPFFSSLFSIAVLTSNTQSVQPRVCSWDARRSTPYTSSKCVPHRS